jgi:hypothetical protein
VHTGVPFGQTWLHPPQLSRSVWTLRQTPLQLSVPAGHAAHIPFSHDGVAPEHALPHAPQLVLVVSDRQIPPQST